MRRVEFGKVLEEMEAMSGSSWKVGPMGACPWKARDSALVLHWHLINDRKE